MRELAEGSKGIATAATAHERMNRRWWSLATLVLCILTIAGVAVASYGPIGYRPDITIDNVVRQGLLTVTGSGKSAVARGIHRGTVLDVNAMSAIELYRFDGSPRGAPIAMPVVSSNGVRMVSVPADRPAPRNPFATLTFIVALFSLGLCAYIGVRRPGVLVFALSASIGGTVFSWYDMARVLAALPASAFLVAMAVVHAFANVLPVLVLASFAVRLPGTDPTPAKRIAIRVIDAIVVFGCLLEFARSFSVPLIVSALYQKAFIIVASVVVVFAAASALLTSRREERGRIIIVLTAAVCSSIVYFIGGTLLLSAAQSGVGIALFDVATILVPAALAYAILRHKVLDVAFVFNRTLVYAGTSAIVLVIIAALEYAVEQLVDRATHFEGVLIQVAIAVCVVASARVIHDRIDGLVDRVIFRARHEQEHALRLFSKTAQFYTTEDGLLRDTADALMRYGRVDGAAIYLVKDGMLHRALSNFSTGAETIDEDDPALVALRAHGTELETREYRTAIGGSRLYPMTIAGRLTGVVALGERESGEAMPPDVDDAIVRIVAAAAITLSAIENEELRARLNSRRREYHGALE